MTLQLDFSTVDAAGVARDCLLTGERLSGDSCAFEEATVVDV